MRVLVVDDKKGIRDVLASSLAFFGYEVVTASNGSEALAEFLERPCDLVITDLHMPRMNGCILGRYIKDKSPHTPVVVMTADGTDALIRRVPGGADAFLTKPFSLEEIQKVLQQLLGAMQRKGRAESQGNRIFLSQK